MKPMDLLAFKVVIEPDEDAWCSYYPAWEHIGAATGGETIEEAALNIKEVLEMIVEEIEEGEIEWPITPSPPWEFSKPSIQDAPELVQFKCAPEHPDAVASHGGLPIADLEPDTAHDDDYRLIYVAVEDVLAAIHQRETWRATRTGGRVSKFFALPHDQDGIPQEPNSAGSSGVIVPEHSYNREQARTGAVSGG